MNKVNSTGIEPGDWVQIGAEEFSVIVTDVKTHRFVNGVIEELHDPEVIYRDVIQKDKIHITYGMDKSIFLQKFKKS